jgi:TPR repeat protein
MNMTVIVIGSVSFFMLLAVVFALSLASRNKRIAKEKKAKEVAYRKAIEQSRANEHKERVFKAGTGHVPTQMYLAKEAETKNPREALHWYEKAANEGNKIAMYGIVRICSRAKDDAYYREKARFWETSIAAAEGDSDAQYDRGIALIEGYGVEKDIVKGIEQIEEIAEAGHYRSMLFIGDWYQAEKNASPDYKLSADWHYRAAKLSGAEGKIKMGEHYELGKGVEVNHIRASYWYELGAELGNTDAQYAAGCLWSNRSKEGNSIAYIWLFLAAQAGHEDAARKRDQVAASISVDAIVGLQSLAKPLIKKFEKGPVSKHSIIKAFNKLYGRQAYFPENHGCEFEIFETVGDKPNEDEHLQENFSADDASQTAGVKSAGTTIQYDPSQSGRTEGS